MARDWKRESERGREEKRKIEGEWKALQIQAVRQLGHDYTEAKTTSCHGLSHVSSYPSTTNTNTNTTTWLIQLATFHTHTHTHTRTLGRGVTFANTKLLMPLPLRVAAIKVFICHCQDADCVCVGFLAKNSL